MKKNVLVFPCGSEIGLEIHRSLNFSTHFKLFGGSSVEDHGRFVYKNYIADIPDVEQPGFINRLNEIIVQQKIDFIFPAHDSVVLKLAQASDDGLLKCQVITSPRDTCEIARSKSKTYQHFQGLLPTPKVFNGLEAVTENDLPIFLKPDIGQGSKGTFLAKNLEQLASQTKVDTASLLLQYLPGSEFTIECFTDRTGQLVFCKGRQRQRVANGISVRSNFVDNPKFLEIARKINDELSFRGVWFFQLKEDKAGELTLLEIAPRVSGTLGLLRCKGVNLVLLSLFDALGLDVEILENDYQLTIDRALENRFQHDINYRHVYLDFDDTVVLDGQINPQVMAFVFQCLNQDIKVHLITRHKADLDTTLKGHKLDGIFDDIIWLQNGEPKHTLITAKDSIFIDDSFAERKQVQQSLGIPVFDSHMVESLMERF